MRRGAGWAAVLAVACLTLAGPANACGFGEAPVGCGDSSEAEAKYMLNRVIAAVAADKDRALAAFTHGDAGFRSVDTYVFCVGPDGIMTAHPSPLLLGQNVRDLHDQNGNYFIATMLKTAKPGEFSQIRYLFPRPGSNVATPKTTYYTRAGDQVCGVGVYDGDDLAPAPPAPEARLEQMRQRLEAEMPANLREDWRRFLQALDEKANIQATNLAKAREQVRMIEATLAPDAKN